MFPEGSQLILNTFNPSVPIVNLEIYSDLQHGYGWMHPYARTPFAASLCGTIEQPWSDLQSIRMRNLIWTDEVNAIGEVGVKRIAFSNWTFEVLTLDLTMMHKAGTRLERNKRAAKEIAQTFFQFFLDPVDSEESGRWWKGLKRIELRVLPAMEAEFRRRLDLATKALPLAGLQKKILPLIVFVDDDGTERRLIEQTDAVVAA